MCIYIYIYLSIYLSVYDISTCIYIYVCIYSIYIYIFACTYVCINAYTYIYIYIDTLYILFYVSCGIHVCAPISTWGCFNLRRSESIHGVDRNQLHPMAVPWHRTSHDFVDLLSATAVGRGSWRWRAGHQNPFPLARLCPGKNVQP